MKHTALFISFFLFLMSIFTIFLTLFPSFNLFSFIVISTILLLPVLILFLLNKINFNKKESKIESQNSDSTPITNTTLFEANTTINDSSAISSSDNNVSTQNSDIMKDVLTALPVPIALANIVENNQKLSAVPVTNSNVSETTQEITPITLSGIPQTSQKIISEQYKNDSEEISETRKKALSIVKNSQNPRH